MRSIKIREIETKKILKIYSKKSHENQINNNRNHFLQFKIFIQERCFAHDANVRIISSSCW